MLIEEYQKANKLNIHKHLLTLIKNKLAQSVFQFVCHQNLKEYLKKKMVAKILQQLQPKTIKMVIESGIIGLIKIYPGIQT